MTDESFIPIRKFMDIKKVESVYYAYKGLIQKDLICKVISVSALKMFARNVLIST